MSSAPSSKPHNGAWQPRADNYSILSTLPDEPDALTRILEQAYARFTSKNVPYSLPTAQQHLQSLRSLPKALKGYISSIKEKADRYYSAIQASSFPVAFMAKGASAKDVNDMLSSKPREVVEAGMYMVVANQQDKRICSKLETFLEYVPYTPAKPDMGAVRWNRMDDVLVRLDGVTLGSVDGAHEGQGGAWGHLGVLPFSELLSIMYECEQAREAVFKMIPKPAELRALPSKHEYLWQAAVCLALREHLTEQGGHTVMYCHDMCALHPAVQKFYGTATPTFSAVEGVQFCKLCTEEQKQQAQTQPSQPTTTNSNGNQLEFPLTRLAKRRNIEQITKSGVGSLREGNHQHTQLASELLVGAQQGTQSQQMARRVNAGKFSRAIAKQLAQVQDTMPAQAHVCDVGHQDYNSGSHTFMLGRCPPQEAAQETDCQHRLPTIAGVGTSESSLLCSHAADSLLLSGFPLQPCTTGGLPGTSTYCLGQQSPSPAAEVHGRLLPPHKLDLAAGTGRPGISPPLKPDSPLMDEATATEATDEQPQVVAMTTFARLGEFPPAELPQTMQGCGLAAAASIQKHAANSMVASGLVNVPVSIVDYVTVLASATATATHLASAVDAEGATATNPTQATMKVANAAAAGSSPSTASPTVTDTVTEPLREGTAAPGATTATATAQLQGIATTAEAETATATELLWLHGVADLTDYAPVIATDHVQDIAGPAQAATHPTVTTTTPNVAEPSLLNRSAAAAAVKQGIHGTAAAVQVAAAACAFATGQSSVAVESVVELTESAGQIAAATAEADPTVNSCAAHQSGVTEVTEQAAGGAAQQPNPKLLRLLRHISLDSVLVGPRGAKEQARSKLQHLSKRTSGAGTRQHPAVGVPVTPASLSSAGNGLAPATVLSPKGASTAAPDAGTAAATATGTIHGTTVTAATVHGLLSSTVINDKGQPPAGLAPRLQGPPRKRRLPGLDASNLLEGHRPAKLQAREKITQDRRSRSPSIQIQAPAGNPQLKHLVTCSDLGQNVGDSSRPEQGFLPGSRGSHQPVTGICIDTAEVHTQECSASQQSPRFQCMTSQGTNAVKLVGLPPGNSNEQGERGCTNIKHTSSGAPPNMPVMPGTSGKSGMPRSSKPRRHRKHYNPRDTMKVNDHAYVYASLTDDAERQFEACPVSCLQALVFMDHVHQRVFEKTNQLGLSYGINTEAGISSMFMTLQSWHWEDVLAGALNFLVAGRPKVWLVLKPGYEQAFVERSAQRIGLQPDQLKQLMYEKQFFPTFADIHGELCNIVVQVPGTMVGTLPGYRFHTTVSLGASFATSCNWFPQEWDPQQARDELKNARDRLMQAAQANGKTNGATRKLPARIRNEGLLLDSLAC